MSLSYYYQFTAPATTPASELETFLRGVEQEARIMGFNPTTVLNARFESPEQRDFARRLASSCVIEDERLKGHLSLRDDLVWHHHRESGTVRLIPREGVVLVITDERGRESCFGFLRYPEEIRDTEGVKIMDTSFGKRWQFSDFINSADPRYREIVRMFAEAGYLADVKDEYA